MRPIEMSPSQAAALAALVLDFEAETTDVQAWRRECMRAADVLRAAVVDPPSEWVTRRPPAGSSNFNLDTTDNAKKGRVKLPSYRPAPP